MKKSSGVRSVRPTCGPRSCFQFPNIPLGFPEPVLGSSRESSVLSSETMMHRRDVDSGWGTRHPHVAVASPFAPQLVNVAVKNWLNLNRLC